MLLRRWGITLLFCVVVILILASTKVLQIRRAVAYAQSFPEPSETVEFINVEYSQWRDQLNIIGEIVATRSVNMHTEVAGSIDFVGFVAGSYVEEEDVLIRLDSAVEIARLDAAKAEAALAHLDVQRYQRLLANKASSQDLYDRAKAQLDVALSEIRALEASIDKKTVRAPFSGTTGIHSLEKGAYLPANSLITPLVGDLDTLWLDFSLPQFEAALAMGSKVYVTIGGGDSLGDSLGDGLGDDVDVDTSLSTPIHTPMTATVIAVNNGFSRDSRHIRYRASIVNSSQALRPGEIVRVGVASGPVIEVVKLPVTAIRRDTFGAYVYVLLKQGESLRAQRREVHVAAEYNNTAIVTEGLERGEQVATKGSFKLREHLKVLLSKEANETTSLGEAAQ